MTLMIELTPEVEERLKRKATQRGQAISEYVEALAERDAQDDGEWEALLDAVSEGSENWPVLPSESFESGRASMGSGAETASQGWRNRYGRERVPGVRPRRGRL